MLDDATCRDLALAIPLRFELAELLDEPTDEVWREAVDGLVAQLDSIWN